MMQTFTVQGMTCQHCVTSVTEELMKLGMVTSVNVDLDHGTVDVESDTTLNPSDVQRAIEEAGYSLKN